jgi:SAM-dependent methyltransferase
MEEIYNDAFYRDRQNKTRVATDEIVGRLLRIIPKPQSAVDLGCGVGAWLATLRELGVENVFGLDGPWVNRKYLAIKPEEFQQQDLTKPVSLDRRFDLAISLEVAEHLPEECSDQFVQNLVSLSDFVLFSAAPPMQGGANHINEQLIDYWLEKFERSGYVGIDCLRPYIWNDRRIGVWYRQNMALYVKSTRVSELSFPGDLLRPNSYLHPEIFLQQLEEAHTFKGAWKLLRRAIKSGVRSAFSKRVVARKNAV